ncbi:hypothetical protein HZC31_04785 [Candidatus Woesearchaeota archaeon]|nr:hypothetical protein [Candidatus Woesearchaeota archaeon]
MRQLIQKITSLFKTEEVEVVLPKHTVPFSELDAWLEQRLLQNAKSVTETAQPILEKIDDCLFALDANVTKLEHAELRNKNVGARELGIMKGNKSSYIMRSRQFHTQLSAITTKEKLDYVDMKNLASLYSKEIEGYHAATLKPYAVLQHFFANEAYAVAKNIKDVDEVIKQLQQLLNKQSIEAITDIRKQIDLVKQKINQKEKLLAEQKQAEEDYAHFKELETQAEEKRKKVEESSSYQHYLHSLVEKEIASKKTDAHLQILRSHFSVLDKALRKFMKLQPEKEPFLTPYLESPLATLEQDISFSLISVLALVREQLLADALEIKDDKKEKTADELAILTEDYLRSYLVEHHVLVQRQKEIEKRCASDFAKQQYDEAAYMLKTYKEKADAYAQQKEKCVAEIVALMIPGTLLALQNDIQTCTKQDMEIVL